MFFKIAFLKYFSNFMRFQYSCFPMKFATFLINFLHRPPLVAASNS